VASKDGEHEVTGRKLPPIAPVCILWQPAQNERTSGVKDGTAIDERISVDAAAAAADDDDVYYRFVCIAFSLISMFDDC